MSIKLKGQFEFGTDAIGTRHKHGFPVFFADFEKCAETANTTQYAFTHGASGKRFDGIDQRIAGFDIDTGITIGKRLISG